MIPEQSGLRPLGLLAELTYRCPLHCPYCSNPPHGVDAAREMRTEQWQEAIRQAAELGVLHVGFSGGEPLVRQDLEELVAGARQAGIYTNLISSGIGLTTERMQKLKEAGLDSVQISFQSDEPASGDAIAGAAVHARKIKAAEMVQESGLPLTFNVVLHRFNIDGLERIIALAEKLGAARLELANTQFYGWAFLNRDHLLPTRRQVEWAQEIVSAARERLRGRMDVLNVMADYFSDRPKACMNGWGRRYITINPVGDVLPCPTAYEIPGMKFDNVQGQDMRWIWENSKAFNQFRGTGWMPEPCRSCERREIDFGGCRCQAALLTGEARNTDPACALSPHRERLTEIMERTPRAGYSLPVIQWRSNHRAG